MPVVKGRWLLDWTAEIRAQSWKAEVGEAWGFPEGRQPAGTGGVGRGEHGSVLIGAG